MPAPVCDLKMLSSKELENRTRHATAFQRNWTSLHPAPKRTFEFSAGENTKGVPEPVTHVRFLPGSDGRLVLAVQLNRVVCWEVPLGGDDAFVVAERTVPGGTICDVLVNEDATNPATLVVAWTRRPQYHPYADFSALSHQAMALTGYSILGLHHKFARLQSKLGIWIGFTVHSPPSAAIRYSRTSAAVYFPSCAYVATSRLSAIQWPFGIGAYRAHTRC